MDDVLYVLSFMQNILNVLTEQYQFRLIPTFHKEVF